MNVLVVETAFLGDAIISLSLAGELKRLRPDSRITYLVQPEAANLIASSPDVDHVITFDKRGAESGSSGIRKKARELNSYRFDTLFLLHTSQRSQSLAAELNVPIKVGFGGAVHAQLTNIVADSGWTTRYERAIVLLRALLPEADTRTLPRIRCEVPDIVTQFSIRYSTPVAIAPGSAWETKKWGDEKYAELADRIISNGGGVILIGGSDAGGSARVIRGQCNQDCILDLTGRVSLLESAGAIATSSLLVANDSAPAHIAVAVGTPAIMIFGPTSPEFGFAPPTYAGEVVEFPELWCRPCSSHGSGECPTHTHECMSRIRVEDVLSRVTSRMKMV